MRIVCGEQMGTAHLLNIASSLVPPPLCSCCGWRSLLLVRSVIVDIRSPRSSYRRAGRSGGSSLLACCGRLVPVVGSFFSYSSHQHLLGRGHSPVISSCLLRLVRSVYHSACGRGRHPPPRRQSIGMLGRFCLLRVRRIPYRLRPVPRAVPLPVSLRFVIRPVLRHGERGVALRRLFSCGLVACAVACRPWGRDVVSAWRVIILGCSRRGGVLCGLCV